MKPILSPAESAALDRESEARGITTASLMENAGRAVGRAAVGVCGGGYGRRAVVVCGKGNNGGDGFVAARHLARQGLRVTVLLLAEPDSFRGPSASSLRRLAETSAVVRPWSAPAARRELERADVAVDAIFGTGFRGAPEGDHAAAIDALNEGAAPVVAVDIPSGVDGETGMVAGPAVQADVTVTFGAPKAGLVLQPGAAFAGLVEVEDIGFPPDLVVSDLVMVEAEDVAAMVPHRGPETEKRRSGVVLVLAGSRGMTGAVRLVAGAAYRTGAGLVTVATPESAVPVVQGAVAEATFLPLPETPDGSVAAAAFDLLEERLDAYTAVAIGPGMTTNEETADLVRRFVARCPVPFVLDADGLNAFAGRAADLRGRRSEAVLTPHAGEFARLAGIEREDVRQDRVGHARKLAAETQAVVALKGEPMLTAAPGGEVRVNPTGGPVLATAGSGDVLTGAVAALLARGLDPFDAATAAVYLHGVAGDLLAPDRGEGTVASDVMEALPAALQVVAP